MPHTRLAKMFQAYGIRGQALTWIKSWLSGRRQKVGVGVKHFSWRTVLSGVPQGSELGPQLFVLFINDIDDGTLSKISKFVDDSKLCRAVGDDQEADVLLEDLRRMFTWSQDRKMCSGSNTDYKSSEPLKTLVTCMLCNVSKMH